MNKAKLKTYAPQARKDFIAAVTARANLLGISEQNGQLEIAPGEKTGDLVLIAGQAWPAKVHDQRERLIQRMRKEGFAQTLEAVAYTWFNRFAALRFMEIHDYLGHGHRVLSSREGGLPEILTHATELAGVLPGLKAQQIADMKLAGNQDGELYRLLLVAQCNALSNAMPFLFERIDDESELLLPENLLRTDSIITQLVNAIPEEDWAEIEIIGWLYQFYISEKKDEVIGKVVKSEDIPAATQLFTPNWIVKYMVQNSLGAQWLATYPDSCLRGQMEYYIEPAEQTDVVKAQLASITPSQLNPEELTLIDPACGSGHILVEAYELFKAIYLERGYRLRDVPKLILEKNLFGLDIDERAAQLTGFALLMKARSDDRRLFSQGVKLNVMAIQDSEGFNAEELAKGVDLEAYGLKLGDLTALKRLFEHATTFGSLIQVPKELAKKLPELKQLGEADNQDLFVQEALTRMRQQVRQTELLAAQYDAVVANPPYMGNKGMNHQLKQLAKVYFPDAKSDLFACFLERGFGFAQKAGFNAMVTMASWMFLPSYEKFRTKMLGMHTLRNLAHFPYDGKRPTVMGINFGVAVVSSQNTYIDKYQGHYCCSRYYELNENGIPLEFPSPNERLRNIEADEFKKIPGSPLNYWVSDSVRDIFSKLPPLSDTGHACSGLQTGDNELYLRQWHEVSLSAVAFCHDTLDSVLAARWLPHRKGGEFRRWYGNADYVVDWMDDGKEIKANPSARPQNLEYWFKSGVSWSHTSSALFSARYAPTGSTFNVEGPSFFSDDAIISTGLMCSAPVFYLMHLMNPTLHFLVGSVSKVPRPKLDEIAEKAVRSVASDAIKLTKIDWDAYERSWDFQSFPILTVPSDPTSTLESRYAAWIAQNRDTIAEMKRLEEENNRLFIEAYGLQAELTPDVPIEQITLTVNPAYRYGGSLTEEELWFRFRQDTMQGLISYAIGCMMGRYSLDEHGLIYAHADNVGFDATRYKTFPADADGIIPITDELWFEDDAANRIREFLLALWPAPTLDENMAWLAESLGAKGNETPAETIRRYLASSFFKDHLQTYKKRPIYWLFSSGKQGAFQALVYLHRYHEGTLARMRAEYVVPLTGKMQSRIEMLEKDKDAAPSTAARNKIAKQIESLKKKHVELLAYDEKLRHYADRRISLDLDNGVKVNYGKFGDLLAEVKAVTGGKEEA
jgi:type II restriction/modification system DNA methylase subunit YeeA